jgi:ribosomal protein S18 acetylase RimI-like enzyme
MRDSTGSRHIAAMPAAAGPDGHLLEYLAMLGEPPRPERGIVPWSEWVDAEHDDMRVRVEHHTGPRDALRPLFAEAEDSARALDAYLDAGELLVAIVQEEVVGHLQLVEAATGDAGEIKNMAVERDHRRRGIGTTLVEAAVERMRAQGRSTLLVATAAADVDNLRFYQHAGFRVRSVERDAFSPATGYAAGTRIDGIPLRDRVWLDLRLDAATS